MKKAINGRWKIANVFRAIENSILFYSHNEAGKTSYTTFISQLLMRGKLIFIINALTKTILAFLWKKAHLKVINNFTSK